MKRILLIFVFSLFALSTGVSQTNGVWSKGKNENLKKNKYVERESFPQSFQLMNLEITVLKQTLNKVSDRFSKNAKGIIISLPNLEGNLERFEVYEASNFDSDLQAQFPEIRSYAGNGIDDKHARLRISIDPRGLNAMISRSDKGSEFIEPYSKDGKVHAIYKSSRVKGKLPFTCSTVDDVLVNDLANRANSVSRSSSGQLLNFRLAMSVTPEYTSYHGGTKALALAAINTTLTRVNGVFETDFAIHMNLVNNLTIIYDGSVADPYGATDANYNSELQSTLTSVVGEANYDVGHLMGNVGNNGNAGCIGCVCVNGQKGSGYTTSTEPVGDNFDIDFVAHEIGHQFGANHTFSMNTEGAGVNVEPGSGSTIMGYAGITNQDVQPHSDDFFHAASIAQVQSNMIGKTCPTSTSITHGAPVVTAGGNITIPRSTPFMLTGSATDTGGTSSLTYCWEQMDDGTGQTGANSAASATKTSGPNFKSYLPSVSPTRYFPKLTSVFSGSVTTTGSEINVEALSSVARTLNFRLTARDNVAGQGQTGFGNRAVTIDATRGPLTVTSQNTTGISYAPGSTQTVTWAVNNTNTSTGGANVDILITTDAGTTWTTLLANTPNDGSETVVMPTTPAPFCRLMVKASGSVFFNVNSRDFAVGYTVTTTCNSYTMNTGFAIPDNNQNYTVRAINVPTTASVTDVNLAVNLTHTWISDINIALVDPSGTSQINVFNGSCTSNDNINATFDDQGSAIVCAPTITGNVIPAEPLSIYNGINPNGDWLIGVRDLANQDTGNVVSYTLTICSQEAVLSSENFGIEGFVLYPNPNNGSFNIQFNSNTGNNIKVGVHDIRGREILNKGYQNNGFFNQSINLENVQTGIYIVTVEDGPRKEIKKIVVQ